MAGKKKKRKYHKQVYRLKQNHNWDAPEGYKVVVLDRGVVSFNVPRDWVVAGTEPFTLHDKEPPDDNIRLSVSFWRLQPGIDWSALPLGPLLAESMKNSEFEILDQEAMTDASRSDMELVWTQRRFQDPAENRPAYTRLAMARGWDVHVFITADFWPEDAEKLKPVWDEVLRSLQLGRYIKDPTLGDPKH